MHRKKKSGKHTQMNLFIIRFLFFFHFHDTDCSRSVVVLTRLWIQSPSYRKIETVIKWIDPEELAMVRFLCHLKDSTSKSQAEEKRKNEEKNARKRAGSLQPQRKDKRSDRPTRRFRKPVYNRFKNLVASKICPNLRLFDWYGVFI